MIEVVTAAWSHPRWGPALKLVLLIVGLPLAINVVFERNPPVGLLLNGVVVGSLYSLIAIGLVLVYRVNRIINFAQAGMGAAPAVLALLLYTSRGVPYVLALLIMLIGAGAIGATVETTVVRRFDRRPKLILTVATIGVAQILAFVEFFTPKWVSGEVIPPTQFSTPFTRHRAEIGGVFFTADHLVTVLVVVAVTVGLGAFFRYSRIGIAVRATAENPDRARLLGIPTGTVSVVVWVIASVLSGLGVFLRAPLVGLPLGSLIGPAILFFALAAAVIARMDSLPVAVASGMAIGVIDQAAFFSTQTSEISNTLMLPIILVALLLQRSSSSRADDISAATLQSVREFRRLSSAVRSVPAVNVARTSWFAFVGAAAVLAPFVVGEVRRGVLTLMVIYAVIGVSLVVLTGWAGQISLGQFAFAGIGAAVAGGLAADAGADAFVALVCAGLAGAATSVAVGLPALRLPGLFLAATTLAFAANASSFFLNRRWFSWLLPEPINQVQRPVLFGRVDLRGDTAFYYACLAVFALVAVSAASIRRSRSGRLFIAARDNPRAVQAYGADLARTRLAAFAYAGFIAAIGGALLAYQQGAVDAGVFSPTASVQIFAMVVIGGLSSVWGAVAGAMYVIGFQYLLPDYQLLATGAGMLVLLLVFPGGLAEVGHTIRDRVVAALAPGLDLVADGPSVDDVVTPVDPEPGAAVAVAGVDAPNALLSARGIEVSYGSVQILFGIDFEVRRGEILALLGTNGAGKSTLLRAVTGLAGSSGELRYDGADITDLTVQERAGLGIVQMPGGAGVFPSLTVDENLRLAAWLQSDATAVTRTTSEVLERFPILAERHSQKAGNLSGGEQQMLALGMSFIMQPELLMIDELSLGLAPTIVEDLLGIVRAMHEAGTTIVLVEQSVNVALTVADRAYFLEKGAVRFEGPTAALLERDDVMRAVFLPSSPPAPLGPSDVDPATTMLEVVGLRRTFGGITAVDDVDLQLHGGEILGLIGHNGAGKTTIFDLISGYLAPDAGEVHFAGQDVASWSPARRARAGLGRSFQDARLFPALTVAENLALALERHLLDRDHVAAALRLPAMGEQEDHIAWSVVDLCELLGLGPHRHKLAGELSTGMRRIVDLGMALAHDPDVLLLDEPSAGVAQREAEALGPMLRRIRDETGAAILIIEHDMPLLLSLCDRLVALETGAVITSGSPGDVIAHPTVVASYLGTDDAAVGRSGARA